MYNILINNRKKFSPELSFEFNVNDKIYSEKEHKQIRELKTELVAIIDYSINEFGQEVTSRHKPTNEVIFNTISCFLTPELTEKGIQTYLSGTSEK
ncbi:hypothetical protein [Lactococcus garvieae]|uniref:hypothetical protein n=1 Tax=Lactococcus garvieae TaxID=1363 RepID=UPI00385518E3